MSISSSLTSATVECWTPTISCSHQVPMRSFTAATMRKVTRDPRHPKTQRCNDLDEGIQLGIENGQNLQRSRQHARPFSLPFILCTFCIVFLSNYSRTWAFTNQRRSVSRPSNLLISSSFSHVPQTQTISQSIRNFGRYCLRSTFRKKKDKPSIDPQPQQALGLPSEPLNGLEFDNKETNVTRHVWRSEMKRWNQQRKYLVQLANYKSHIVIPSFSALTIGALMVSMIPHYEARCIQMVATLHKSQSEVIYAILGLVVTSTLAAIFTGVRGALFWIAGSRANYNIRVKLHERLLYVHIEKQYWF